SETFSDPKVRYGLPSGDSGILNSSALSCHSGGTPGPLSLNCIPVTSTSITCCGLSSIEVPVCIEATVHFPWNGTYAFDTAPESVAWPSFFGFGCSTSGSVLTATGLSLGVVETDLLQPKAKNTTATAGTKRFSSRIPKPSFAESLIRSRRAP